MFCNSSPPWVSIGFTLMGQNCWTHPPCVVDDAEISFVLELTWLLELGVSAQLLQHLIHERLVGGLGEPALLVEQSQDPRRVRLKGQDLLKTSVLQRPHGSDAEGED